MRQSLLRFGVAPSLLALSCATAIEEGGFGAPLDTEDGGASNNGGSLATSGTGGGSSSSGSNSTPSGGKAGSSTGAFGGTSSTAGSTAQGGKAGSTSGGTGNGGSANGGSASGGKGGAGSSGTSNGGSGTAGSGAGSTVCDGIPDWTPKTYANGDTVASTCSGVFAGTCTPGQSHKFQCNPAAGVPALPWCTSREPGVGNGWAEAWVDQGQCQ
jgi:hypothetical protein